jgi:hypothetical protein
VAYLLDLVSGGVVVSLGLGSIGAMGWTYRIGGLTPTLAKYATAERGDLLVLRHAALAGWA